MVRCSETSVTINQLMVCKSYCLNKHPNQYWFGIALACSNNIFCICRWPLFHALASKIDPSRGRLILVMLTVADMSGEWSLSM